MQLFSSATRGLSVELSKNEGMGVLGAKYRTETRDVETLLAAPSKHLCACNPEPSHLGEPEAEKLARP